MFLILFPSYLYFLIVYAIENPQVIDSIKKKQYSEVFRNFVDLCVTKNYQVRLNSKQLLQHPYVKKLPRKNLIDYFQSLDRIVEEKSKNQKKSKFKRAFRKLKLNLE